MRTDTKTWLEDYLQAGMRPAAEVLAAAVAEGHSERTLRRVKSELEVESVKDGVFGGISYWALPGQAKSFESYPANAATGQGVGSLCKNGSSKGNGGNDSPKAANSCMPSPHDSLRQTEVAGTVHCGGCTHYEPDRVGDGTGIGNCRLGNPGQYPRAEHYCEQFERCS